jgi:DNA-binding GntR family transcriptional regulator
MLEQNSSQPLYDQLKQIIISGILSGQYKHGQRLPSETQLAEMYGISRITVRRALAELEAEGYLSTQQGRGTFINFIKGEIRLMSFATMSDNPTDASLRRTNRIISKTFIDADATLAKYLKVPIGTKLIRLYRVMLENDKPYSLDTAFFIVDRYPNIFEKIVDNVSTFEILTRDYGVKFDKAVKVMGILRAGVEEAKLLQCAPGDPLFSISKVMYDANDVPLHYSHYLVLGDRCVYTLTVTHDMMDTQVRYREKYFGPE